MKISMLRGFILVSLIFSTQLVGQTYEKGSVQGRKYFQFLFHNEFDATSIYFGIYLNNYSSLKFGYEIKKLNEDQEGFWSTRDIMLSIYYKYYAIRKECWRCYLGTGVQYDFSGEAKVKERDGFEYAATRAYEWGPLLGIGIEINLSPDLSLIAENYLFRRYFYSDYIALNSATNMRPKLEGTNHNIFSFGLTFKI